MKYSLRTIAFFVIFYYVACVACYLGFLWMEQLGQAS